MDNLVQKEVKHNIILKLSANQKKFTPKPYPTSTNQFCILRLPYRYNPLITQSDFKALV